MTNKIKAVLIDDEEFARGDLRLMLSKYDEIEIIGEAEDAESGRILVEKLNPEVIFLDIQMPGKSGFELLNELQTEAKIIFVTAYDDYAIKAFEVNAQDYLLKPVSQERLNIALERVIGELSTIHNNEKNKKLDYDDTVFLQVNNCHQFIKVSSIIKIVAAGCYCEIHTANRQKILVLRTMKEWEERLPEKKFVRIHRNAIINLDFVDRIEEWFNHSYQVFLKDIEKPLIMSRRYVVKLKEKMA